MEKKPLFKKARISSIPKDWNISSVGNACSIRNDLRRPISVNERATIKGIYPYYGPTGILDYINEFLVEDHFLKPDEKPQTILAKGQFNVNNHAHLIESTDTCCSQWFSLYFRHRNITDFLSRQGANRYKLNKATLEKLPIILPPLPEQKAIADLLSTWDEAIEKTERLIEAKEKRFKWLLKTSIGDRCLKDNEKTGWTKTCLCEICKVTKGQQLNISQMQDDGFYYALNGGVEPSGRTDNWNTEADTITISEGGNSCGYVKLNKERFWSGGHCYSLLNLKKSVFNYFLFFYLKLNEPALMRLRVGSGLPNIQKKDVDKFQVILPPLEIQHKIAETLLYVQQDINLLKQLLDKYKIQKRGLMQKMLSGEWRVRP